MPVTTLTNSCLAHYRSPSSPHRHAPHNLRPTGPKTRTHHLPPTRPSPNRHNLVLSTGSSGPQNPRPRLRNPPAADLSSGRGGEQDVGLDQESVRVEAQHEQGVLQLMAFGKRVGNNRDLLDVITETNVLLSGFCVGDFFPEWKWVNLQRDDLEVPITDENIKALVMDCEALRLHPPTPLLPPRESMDKCILDGFEIPAKTRVVINAFAIGRDPKSWEDPLVYNPERFIDDRDDKNGSVVDIDQVRDQELKFIPFGAGRRRCPGFAFGLATIEIALARLLYHFDWELPPEVLGPHDVDLDLDEIFGLASRRKSTLVLVPKTNKDFPYISHGRLLHSRPPPQATGR
ncbi:hypothetical protein FEM48_Zijuj03G0028700 [Ziziphus jujuba var. spinosa]|uniref:Cytochrome P450 71A1-like n=1 Tax=Ziziphus jujuba var. spinosa TaxID=714518 RepID=A0A978VMR2_ZIZJJ|nr:hypothetical protein FEM48_Zijuj03G0028700 [Ziziphus jujuba var. spinosa]